MDNKIIEVINYVRPYLINEGGNIEFIKYENSIVYIKMLGACANCSLVDVTIKDSIEAILKEEIPEIKEVININ